MLWHWTHGSLGLGVEVFRNFRMHDKSTRRLQNIGDDKFRIVCLHIIAVVNRWMTNAITRLYKIELQVGR